MRKKYWKKDVIKSEFLEEIFDTERIPSGEELKKMYHMEKDRDSLVRADLAKALVNKYTPESETMLRRMACDRDELVRIEALDSLCIGREKASLALLKWKMKKAEERMERGYAASSYFTVWINRYGYHRESMQKYLESVEEIYQQEKDSWVLAHYERNRYKAGEKNALERLTAILMEESKEDSYVGYAAKSCMGEIMNIFNKNEMKNILKEFLPSIPENFRGLQVDTQKLIEKKIYPQVLLLSRENTGLSLLMEYISYYREEGPDLGIALSSAGLEPGEEICAELVRMVKQKDNFDLCRLQYPKPIMHGWWQDFIVPVGIKVRPEDYPFQKVLTLFENVDENELDYERAEKMVWKLVSCLRETYGEVLEE